MKIMNVKYGQISVRNKSYTGSAYGGYFLVDIYDESYMDRAIGFKSNVSAWTGSAIGDAISAEVGVNAPVLLIIHLKMLMG